MMEGEKLITAILTQAVEDAKYTGTNKKKLKHKIEALRWIEDDDPACCSLRRYPVFMTPPMNSFPDPCLFCHSFLPCAIKVRAGGIPCSI